MSETKSSDTKTPAYFKILSPLNEVGRQQSQLILNYLESVNSRIQYWIAIFFPSNKRTGIENPQVLATKA